MTVPAVLSCSTKAGATRARRRLGLGHSEFLSGAGAPFWDSLRATTDTGTSVSSRGPDRCAFGAPRAALRGPGTGGISGDESTPGPGLEGSVRSPGARLAAAALRGQSSGGMSDENSPAGVGPAAGGLGSPGARLSAAAASASSGGGVGSTAAAVVASEAATMGSRGGGGGSHARNSVNGGWVGRNAGGAPTTTITATASCGSAAAAGSSERGGVISPTVERNGAANGAANGSVNGASNGASHSNGAGNGGVRKAGGGPQMPTGGGDGDEEEEEDDEDEEGGEGSIVANAIEVRVSFWVLPTSRPLRPWTCCVALLSARCTCSGLFGPTLWHSCCSVSQTVTHTDTVML